MKLSIITINRNNAEGLRKTMHSVFSQTYRDFEYIIIDGTSTDDSVQVIKEVIGNAEGEACKVDWVSEPDSGVYNAMNKGIKRAKGDYCLFLNSGDFLVADDVLEKVFEKCNGADILCARCNVSDSGKVVWTSHPPQQITFGTLYYAGLAHQSTFIKRALFDTCGLYREDFKYNSDIAFWYVSIIDHRASTQTLNVVTTDYNLDGISSKENSSEQYACEMQQILAPYNRFVADYEAVKAKGKDNEMWYWVKRHRWLLTPIGWIYKIACIVNK